MEEKREGREKSFKYFKFVALEAEENTELHPREKTHTHRAQDLEDFFICYSSRCSVGP